MEKRILDITEMNYPEIKILDPKLKYGFKLLNAVHRIRGKTSLLAAEVLIRDLVIPWMVKAYEIYTEE
ncbi:MAG: hypothetical protein ACFFER_05140 [Candidatus Thorarchaeota archaeon]